jgi:hypothetical protein
MEVLALLPLVAAGQAVAAGMPIIQVAQEIRRLLVRLKETMAEIPVVAVLAEVALVQQEHPVILLMVALAEAERHLLLAEFLLSMQVVVVVAAGHPVVP